MNLDNVVTLLAKSIIDVQKFFRVRMGLGPIAIEVSIINRLAKESIDARLEKIEGARESLKEALGAIDDLKETAEENRRDLERLTKAINVAETEKAGLSAQLDALKQIASLDSNAVREALRLPSTIDIWRERIYGFVFGILAAVIGAFIWELGVRPVWERYHSSPVQQEAPVPPNQKTK